MHPAGVIASAVEAAAFPVVLLGMVAGNRADLRIPLVMLDAFLVSVVTDRASP